jgi:hypothetical protein
MSATSLPDTSVIAAPGVENLVAGSISWPHLGHS